MVSADRGAGGQGALAGLLDPVDVLGRVPAAVTVWDGQLRCWFANQAARRHRDPDGRRLGSGEGETLSEWLGDPDAFAAYLPHATSVLAGQPVAFGAMFRARGSEALRYAHVWMEPLHAASEAGQNDAPTEPVGMQMLAVSITGGAALREQRLAAAEERGGRRAMAQVAEGQQDVIRRLFGVTLQLASISQRRQGVDVAIGSVIDTVDAIIRDLRSLTIPN